MRSFRFYVLAVVALALTAAALLIVADFAKITRSIPALAAPEERADLIVIEKSARTLTLIRDGNIIKTYRSSLGRSPLGHKEQEGDGRTPEGKYLVDFKNARSRFHLALRISYPDAQDKLNAQSKGVPAGSDIMIHGLPNGLGWLRSLHLRRDWTDGCVAVTNREIEEIWRLVDVNTAVEIRP